MDRSPLLHFFLSSQLVGPLSAAQIAEQFRPRLLAKGELFLKEGRVSNEYLFLQQGTMRAFAHDPQGADLTTSFYTSGAVVFEVSSFFQRKPSQENIQALTDCEGWIISYEELNGLFHSMPEFREFGRSVLVRGYAALKDRMLGHITETAEKRYEHLLEQAPEIFQYAPLKNIASYLGVTDTSLSRIRKELTRK
jgi:CRP-like cAMP-binding protein